MKSIRAKLITLIACALIMTTVTMGGISFYATNKLTEQYADKYITTVCEKNAIEINSMLQKVEQAVKSIGVQVVDELSNPMNLADEVYCNNFTEMMSSNITNIANNTYGAVAVYLRYNPEIADPTAGIFMIRENMDEDMVNITPTDLSKYPEDDVEHVGWYYEPVNAGTTIWMEPYYNKNIDINIISFVFPIYKDNVIVGVAGMDVNFEHISDIVGKMNIYDSGYAYITKPDNTIIYHPSLQKGYNLIEKKEWKIFNTQLQNGMQLSLTAPNSEINQTSNSLIKNIVLMAVGLLLVFLVITTWITGQMIRPLQKLNDVAVKIADGDYNVDFKFKRPDDEIGQLTSSFEKTADNLKKYMDYINSLAYKDSLTGVKNKTAYDEEVEKLNRQIRAETGESFAIVVFDVNNLKKINDSYGHEMGNLLLKGACDIICKAFSECQVFRIGGDEFVAVAKGDSLKNLMSIYAKFKMMMDETKDKENPAERIAIACGWAEYDRAQDFYSVESVFKRADTNMYANKCEMKKINGEKPR